MRTEARVAQSAEKRRRLLFEAQQLERAIEREIREAWMDLQQLEERMAARAPSLKFWTLNSPCCRQKQSWRPPVGIGPWLSSRWSWQLGCSASRRTLIEPP